MGGKQLIDISEKSYLKYLLFGSLYFSEGLEFALILVIIPIYLIESGVSIPIATLVTGIATIPWMIKFVWGGIVDYYIKYGRKRFILIGSVLGSCGFILLGFIDPFVALIPFACLLFLTHIGTGFFDASADAWAIEISKEEERGKINGSMIAGTFAGMGVGSSLFGFIAKNFGYNYVFFLAGIIVLIIIIFPLLVKEIITVKKHQKVIHLLVDEFKKKKVQLISFFVPVSMINSGLMMFLVPLYMKTVLNLDIVQIGLIAAIFPIAKAVGAISGGIMADRWGRKRTLYIIMIIAIFFSAFFIFADNWQILAIIYGVIGFLHGGYFASICTMVMDVTNPRIGATQFSVLTSLANIGEIGTGSVSGSLVATLGFSRMFLFSAWALGPPLLILYFIKLKKSKKEK